jgi:hypothetical protein
LIATRYYRNARAESIKKGGFPVGIRLSLNNTDLLTMNYMVFSIDFKRLD